MTNPRDETGGQGGADPPRGFEEELRRLEEIVERLESEEVSLEAALELFEEGTAIVRSARQMLEKSRMKVRELLGEEGDFSLEDFETEEASDAGA